MANDPTEIRGFEIAAPRQSSLTSDGALRLDAIEGLRHRVIRPVAHTHGHLSEIYRSDWGITDAPVVQVNLTTTLPGRVRAWGLHLHTIDRLFVASGSVRIVCWDGRTRSRTQGRVNELVFSDRTQGLVVIPVGVYHGWKNVGETEAVMVSMPSRLYDHDGPDRYELPWDAPATRAVIPYEW